MHLFCQVPPADLYSTAVQPSGSAAVRPSVPVDVLSRMERDRGGVVRVAWRGARSGGCGKGAPSGSSGRVSPREVGFGPGGGYFCETGKRHTHAK